MRRGHRTGESRGLRATVAALLANIGVAIAKFVAWGFTGSASMLAEAVHSVADSGNETLLLWGRHRARREPSTEHPFGFGRERYFWAFVVSIVLFTAGGLFALREGIEKLLKPHELSSFPWAVGVLLASMVLEGASLRTAVRESTRRRGESWLQYVRRSTVPELIVVLLEDTGALIGLSFALAGTTLAEVTGNSRFDAIGSVGIGILLVVIAATLAIEMKSLLIGEAAGSDEVDAIERALRAEPGIHDVIDLRTSVMSPEHLLVVAVVELDSDVADATAIDRELDRAEAAVRAAAPRTRLVYLRPHTKHPAPSPDSGGGSSRYAR